MFKIALEYDVNRLLIGIYSPINRSRVCDLLSSFRKKNA